MADGSAVYIGECRALLAGQLNADAIAWTGEAWLGVVGTPPGGAHDLPHLRRRRGGAVRGSPGDRAVRRGGAGHRVPVDAGQVLLFTEQGRYTFGSRPSGENSLKNPFYVS